jgi:uncharacterized protein (TIGR02145 family)
MEFRIQLDFVFRYNICPAGWHFPSFAEFSILSTTADGNALKALGIGVGGGVGTNTSGFTALLAGNSDVAGIFENLGLYVQLWTPTSLSGTEATAMGLPTNQSSIAFGSVNKQAGFSVRCIRD